VKYTKSHAVVSAVQYYINLVRMGCKNEQEGLQFE